MDHFLARLELAFQGRAHVVRQVIDDVVLADLDAALVGQGLGALVGHDVEADDERVLRRGPGQPDVVFRDAADGRFQDADADLRMYQLLQLLADGLDGAAGLGLEDDLQLGDLGLAEGLQADRLARCQGCLLQAPGALLGNHGGLRQVVDD